MTTLLEKSNINLTYLGRKLELQYVANFEVKQRRSLSLLQKRRPIYHIFLSRKPEFLVA